MCVDNLRQVLVGATAGPNPPQHLIEGARAELAAQLDGTRAALDAAEEVAILRATVRRHGRATCEGLHRGPTAGYRHRYQLCLGRPRPRAVAIDRQELPGAGHPAQLDAGAVLEAGARADDQVTHGARDEDFTGAGLDDLPDGWR
jgi:hypothetical protein